MNSPHWLIFYKYLYMTLQTPLLITFLFFATCSVHAQNVTDIRLADGDLLFQDLDCGPVCDAIEKVTRGVDGRDFSHVGIVYTHNDSLFVIEATGGKGVCITPLQDFLNRSRDSNNHPKVVTGRLKKKYRKLIPEAISFAQAQEGLPYDPVFAAGNNKYYCSELVYDAYKHANGGKPFFQLQPMTFNDPATGRIFPAWQAYYEKLGTAVPEGEPGCNPGGLSRSRRLRITGRFY